MFAPRYFAPRYFAPRYFSNGADVEPAVLSLGDLQVVAGVLELFDDTATSTLEGPNFPFSEQAFLEFGDLSLPGGTQVVYMSDIGFTTDAGDDPEHEYFAPRLVSSFNVEASLFDGAEPTGGSVPAFGDIRLSNADGGLDNLINLDWDFRKITLYSGLLSQEFKDFTQILEGRIQNVMLDETGISLKLQDKLTAIDRTLQSTFYAGSGGLEGTSDNEGKPMPQSYGKLRNITPVLIDPVNHVYQVNDRVTNAISAVKDQGVAKTPDTTPDVADVFAWTPVAGKFVTDLVNGVFRLGDKPAGQITCDVEGDANGSYVNTTADITERIITERLGVENLSAAELNSASFTAFNSAQGSVVGIWTGSEPVSAKDIIDALVGGAGGTWYFERAGTFSIVLLTAPSSPSFTLGIDDLVDTGLGGIERSTPQQPSFERRVQHTRNWTVQERGDLAGSVSDADRAFLEQRFRVSLAEDTTVFTKYNLAIDVEIVGFFDTAGDGDTEADRLLALHKVPRHIYQVMVVNGLFTYWLNDVITLDFERWELDGGKDLRVISIQEDAAENITTLTLWG